MDEVEKRIEAARVSAERQKQNKGFLEGLTKNDDLVKPIYNPEAFVMRSKASGAASRGDMPRTSCTHPLAYIQQYLDDDPLIARRGNPVNLFECGVCHTLIWFVDPWGSPVTDD